MKICILQRSTEDDSTFVPYAPELYIDTDVHTVQTVNLRKQTVGRQLTQLAWQGFDCFINLCDSSWDSDSAGIEVIMCLEKLNLPYTGANVDFYEPTRLQMKKVSLACGLKTALWAFCYSMAEVEAAGQRLTYPLIVKHFNSHDSIGMSKDCCCTNVEALRQQAEIMLQNYGGTLIEEFIEGREFTVLVTENVEDEEHPIAYEPVECIFPHGETFKHFDLKWKEYEKIKWAGVGDGGLCERLKDLSRKVFHAMRGRGYGRIDVRSDPTGENLYFLEINPQCSVFYEPQQFGSADIILDMDTNTSHRQFLEHLIALALHHHRRKQPVYESEWTPEKGFGLYARKDFAVGEIVQVNEEKPTVLVSRQHAMATFREEKMKDFHAYAWPLSKDVYVTWHSDPDMWAPINHSCDPNTVLSGLNTIARKPIEKGSELTIDYCTFCTDCTPFACQCGSAECRGSVTGKEYLNPKIMSQYENHLSCHVQTLYEESRRESLNSK